MCIEDVAFRALLKIMLEDCNQRPDATMLLDHPIIKFFKLVVPQSYPIAQEDFSPMLDELSRNDETCPALVSTLYSNNKDKAFDAFSCLTRLYLRSRDQ